jgi:hypothetical protein
MGLPALIPIFIALATIALAFASNLAISLHGIQQERLARYDLLATAAASGYLQQQGVTLQTTAWNASTNASVTTAGLTAMPSTAVCANGVVCGITATATYAIDGSTAGTATANNDVVAPNIESAAHETRTAVTINVALVDANGVLMYARPHRVKLRLYGTNGAEVTALQDGAGQNVGFVNGAAENDGCAIDGSGCDPNRVTTQDPTTVDAVNQCVQGYGSGTCSTQFPSAADKTNATWSNGQAAASNGP